MTCIQIVLFNIEVSKTFLHFDEWQKQRDLM